MKKSAVFISYRRDDCPGYAGRLEDALERVYGKKRVFRDIRDIEAGEDFAKVIESGLASAGGTLALIGPRWAGVRADGQRRIDDAEDFVRLEVARALASDCKVIPVLLAGTTMPKVTELPEPLRELASLQALTLEEENWDADIQRLIEALDLPTRRAKHFIVGGAAVLVLAAAAVALYLHETPSNIPVVQPHTPPAPVDPSVETANRLVGTWEAPVRYGWGDTAQEQFVFKRFAGEITGTASFLKYPRGIESVTIKGSNLEFVTHTIQSMNDQDRELTHRYQAELDGDTLRIRMHTTGGFTSHQPLEFEAKRVTQAAG
jgi:hypothetical protein